MPSSPAWCLWLNCTGWARATRSWVTYAERLTSASPYRPPTTANSAPKMLNRESVLVLRWKIWGIARREAIRHAVGRNGPWHEFGWRRSTGDLMQPTVSEPAYRRDAHPPALPATGSRIP